MPRYAMTAIDNADRALRLAAACHEAARKRFRAGEIDADGYCAIRREYDEALDRWHRAELALLRVK